jgi:dihydroorotate dehydrogenase/Pyruvate/2-oxoacid:ferredoxin oxidoreductase delta subunit
MTEFSSSRITAIDSLDPNGRLKSDLFDTEYRSPLVVASGTLIEEYSEIAPYIEAGAGAVIPRSTRNILERTVHPSPHLYQDGKGSNATMLNGEWTGAAIDYWRPHLDSMTGDNKVIMSVSGRDIEGCVKVCKELDDYGFPLFEVNISCGVSNGVHGYITRNIEHIQQVCTALKEADIRTPISLKLGHSDAIVDLAGSAKEAGADAITAINTYGPVFDFRIGKDGQPDRVIGAAGAKGGLSGAALFHTALTDVAEISRQIDIPVLASGGVMNAERAVKMIMAGASLVQLYTVLHEKGINGPAALAKFNKELLSYMDSHNIDRISDVKAAALPLMERATELKPRVPIVDALGCIGCNACVRVCLPEAFEEIPADNRAGHIVTITDACVGCGHCISECPVPDVLTLSPEAWNQVN